jgi:hypothetical protein
MAQTTTQVVNDDLSRIRQLGPGTIRCFEEAGLDGLRALAVKTPRELSALCGYPVDRIMKEDWVGQARRLTGGDDHRSELVVAPPDDPSHRVATFRLEVTVQPDGRVHHTDVMYLQNEVIREIWSDWETTRLVDFVQRVAQFEKPEDRQAAAAIAAARPELSASDAPPVEPPGFELGFQLPGSSMATQLIDGDEHPDVVVGFSLQGIVAQPTQPVRYKVTVVGIEIEGDHRFVVAESAATDSFGDGEFYLRLPAWIPKAGMHRLRADIIVADQADDVGTLLRLRSGPVMIT